MDTQRIKNVIDVETLKAKCVAIVGVGGAANLCRNLVRCGVQQLKLVDMDAVSESNICRQEHMADQIGQAKVEALKAGSDPKKRASCERLKSAGAASVFFMVSLAKLFSNRLLPCLVHARGV